MVPTRRQAIMWTNDGQFTDAFICVTQPLYVGGVYSDWYVASKMHFPERKVLCILMEISLKSVPGFPADNMLCWFRWWLVAKQVTLPYITQCWLRSLMPCGITRPHSVNTLRSRQSGQHFAENIFKCIFLNENMINISRKFVPKGQISNILVLVQIMAWCWPGDKPLSEPMMASLLTHICIRIYASLCLNGFRPGFRVCESADNEQIYLQASTSPEPDAIFFCQMDPYEQSPFKIELKYKTYFLRKYICNVICKICVHTSF